MKAEELRKGVWINNGRGVNYYDFQVGDVSNGVVQDPKFNKNFLISSCEGIPLTESWLLKLGFKNNGFIDWQFDSPHENDYRICFSQDKFIFRGLGASIVEIKTVHHLQNLYFFLTNQELCLEA